MDYKMTIAGVEKSLPLCKITDDLYIAGFIMFNDVPVTEATARELLKLAPDFDVLLTAETKGIPLTYEMARQSGKPYIVARKGAKLYMQDVITVTVKSITTSHVQMLCLGKDECDVLRGKKILIVDDVISTGESVAALEQLVETVGAETVGKFAVLAEGEAADRKDITYLEYLPLFNADGTPQ
ncbi:MAG: adenine phosphoribosyltransferase [Mogibacterium sp.]|nr:adenine phosphoribosyltransferase [Mogibacterium sp.]